MIAIFAQVAHFVVVWGANLQTSFESVVAASWCFADAGDGDLSELFLSAILFGVNLVYAGGLLLGGAGVAGLLFGPGRDRNCRAVFRPWVFGGCLCFLPHFLAVLCALRLRVSKRNCRDDVVHEFL
jgi:hypothetical protein